uniref:Uncharacterized protein n=1 Tax=Kryptolebias marmoratus TaxID=37003 RepID=A0A3Q2ZMW0_KRYMA
MLITGLKQQNSHLTQVEVNKMLGLVGYVAAEVPPNDAVPYGGVGYLLDVGSDVFLDVVLLQGLCGTLHGVLLHVLRHVSVFDHWLSVRHGCPGKPKEKKQRIRQSVSRSHNDTEHPKRPSSTRPRCRNGRINSRRLAAAFLHNNEYIMFELAISTTVT